LLPKGIAITEEIEEKAPEYQIEDVYSVPGKDRLN
jgi:hypothetical protein